MDVSDSSCQDSRLGAAESLTRSFGRGCQRRATTVAKLP